MGQFYEDAVVVGNDFMVLEGGVGKTKGLNGLFSHHHCLSIAKHLESFSKYRYQDMSKKIYEASIESIKQLGFFEINPKLRDVAATFVYMKLHYNQLFTGFIGNSGFSIYRYNEEEGIMKLTEKSNEDLCEKDTPCRITSFEKDELNKNTYDVLEGDVVMAYSDGVSNVVPSSFITAATNYLVARMIQKKRQGKSLDDFDYDYDLADFVEGYAQNLNELSLKFKEKFIKDLYKLKHEEKYLFEILNIKPFEDDLKPLKTQEEIDRFYFKHLDKLYFPTNEDSTYQNLNPKKNNVPNQVELLLNEVIGLLHKTEDLIHKENKLLKKLYGDQNNFSKPSKGQIQSKDLSSTDSGNVDIDEDFSDDKTHNSNNINSLADQIKYTQSINAAISKII